MAYLHCHTKNCGWSQDDFWELGGYTPINLKYIGDGKNLFKDKIYFDKGFFEDNLEIPNAKDENGWYCKGTDYVAWDLERRARRIRNMLVRTYEEFKEKKDELFCPRCGRQNWDID